MSSFETVRQLVTKCGRKRSINPTLLCDEPPHKKSTGDIAYRMTFLNIPFMIRVQVFFSLVKIIIFQICSYLDLTNQKILWETCPEGKETVLHFWRAQRRLNLCPTALKALFPIAQDCSRFDSMFSLRCELVDLFAWLQKSTIRELDLRGVKSINWALFETIVHDKHGPVMANIFENVLKLRLEGCYLNSDDLHNAGVVLPHLEVITLSDRTFTIYEDVDGTLPNTETRGRMNKKRTMITKLLKHCFPRLRVIRFY